jgi:hypothetical protein
MRGSLRAKYTDVNYVYTSIPERGYNYYKVADNAYYIHNEFDSMVFFITDVGVVVYDARPEQKWPPIFGHDFK